MLYQCENNITNAFIERRLEMKVFAASQSLALLLSLTKLHPAWTADITAREFLVLHYITCISDCTTAETTELTVFKYISAKVQRSGRDDRKRISL